MRGEWVTGKHEHEISHKAFRLVLIETSGERSRTGERVVSLSSSQRSTSLENS